MKIAFKAAYRYDPSDKKDVKTVNEMLKRQPLTTGIAPNDSTQERFVITDETFSKFKDFLKEEGVPEIDQTTRNNIVDFSHNKGVAIDNIKYTELYEKLNFNIAKKAFLAIGRGIKQIIN